MKKKTSGIFMGVIIFALAIPFANASANGFGGHDRPKRGKESECMFFRKAHMIETHQNELGLPAEKIKAIKNLTVETKKTLIQQHAEIEIASVEMEAKLHEDHIDVEALNPIIERKYEMKKNKTKTLINAIAQLKNMLTEEEWRKVREIKINYRKRGDNRSEAKAPHER